MPGLPLRHSTHKPESSEIVGTLAFLKKYFAFNSEFALKFFPVSAGLLILSSNGVIFFIFLFYK